MKDATAVIAPRPAVYVRLDKLRELISEAIGADVAPKSEQAAFLGVKYLTMWRLWNNPGHKPSQEFIAAAIDAPWPQNPRPTFDDLFDVRTEVAA